MPFPTPGMTPFLPGCQIQFKAAGQAVKILAWQPPPSPVTLLGDGKVTGDNVEAATGQTQLFFSLSFFNYGRSSRKTQKTHRGLISKGGWMVWKAAPCILFPFAFFQLIITVILCCLCRYFSQLLCVCKILRALKITIIRKNSPGKNGVKNKHSQPCSSSCLPATRSFGDEVGYGAVPAQMGICFVGECMSPCFLNTLPLNIKTWFKWTHFMPPYFLPCSLSPLNLFKFSEHFPNYSSFVYIPKTWWIKWYLVLIWNVNRVSRL